jgi:diacylglycerol kinase family enzyme
VGIPLDPVEAAQALLDNEARPVDLLIDCAGDVVVNAVHVGVGAEAGREAENYKGKLGKLGYYVGALVAGVRMTGMRLRVEADGAVLADLDRPVLQVGIGNGPNVGGGTELVPGAEVDDGQIDVVVSFATGPWQRVAYGARLTLGKHESRPDVSVTRARTVSVSGEDYWCNADGELYGPERNLTWRVEPGALRMVLPPAA